MLKPYNTAILLLCLATKHKTWILTLKVCGYATATDVGGVFKVHFPFISGGFEVLAADYESYACVWSCFGDLLGLPHAEIGYILTREQEYNQETVSFI